MKAALFDGKEISIKDVSNPTLAESQVLIRIKAVGICGTDLAIVNGNLPTPTPLILGHEFAGVVIEVGKEVEYSWIGKYVTSEISSNIDFDCHFCNKNIFTQCISRKALGIDINGSLAEFIAVESYLLHEFPNTLSFEEATFIEPLAAAYQTFEMMPLEDDKIMTIFGMGKLGLLILQVAKLRGLDLIAIDGSDQKLSLARKLGAKYVINRLKSENVTQEIKNLTNDLGADIVVDASGNPNVLSDVVSSCRTRGKIHIKSTHGLSTAINITELVVREIAVYTSRCGPFKEAIQLMKDGQVKVEELISNRYQLDKIKEAVKYYSNDTKNIKTIITF